MRKEEEEERREEEEEEEESVISLSLSLSLGARLCREYVLCRDVVGWLKLLCVRVAFMRLSLPIDL